eukprot:TRINITY_DN61293_c0_g1_i1.p1 TRINITY_DN61293_c0_g1~~TRINITY_DN61293_c0_g1_i1.p1  ORF type:complete len:606 (+),score=137.57 TRINITY_DN61293_c0_g1_i1:99-1916(+)
MDGQFLRSTNIAQFNAMAEICAENERRHGSKDLAATPTTAEGVASSVASSVGHDASDPNSEEGLLMLQAEMGAEQQEKARVTMLDLARAFEDAAQGQRRLDNLILHERRRAKDLTDERNALEMEVTGLRRQIENQREDVWRAKFQSNPRLCRLNLLYSRRAKPVEALATQASATEESDGFVGASASAIVGEDSVDVAACAPGAVASSRGSVGASDSARQRGGCISSSTGDLLMCKWVVRFWADEVKKTQARQRTQCDMGAQTDVEGAVLQAELAKREEEIARLRADMANVGVAARRIAEVEGNYDALQRCFQEARSQHERDQQKHAEEKKEMQLRLDEAAEKQAIDQQRVENLQVEMERVRSQAHAHAAAREAQVAQAEALRKRLEEQEDASRQERASWEVEKQSLQAAISNVTSEMQDAVLTARYLKDAAQRARRNQAASVSPEELAQLVSDLSSMRERLSTLSASYQKVSGENTALSQKLRSSSRRMDLERQFLPLRHTVSGPVGREDPHAQATKMRSNGSCSGIPGVSAGGGKLPVAATGSRGGPLLPHPPPSHGGPLSEAEKGRWLPSLGGCGKNSGSGCTSPMSPSVGIGHSKSSLRLLK